MRAWSMSGHASSVCRCRLRWGVRSMPLCRLPCCPLCKPLLESFHTSSTCGSHLPPAGSQLCPGHAPAGHCPPCGAVLPGQAQPPAAAAVYSSLWVRSRARHAQGRLLGPTLHDLVINSLTMQPSLPLPQMRLPPVRTTATTDSAICATISWHQQSAPCVACNDSSWGMRVQLRGPRRGRQEGCLQVSLPACCCCMQWASGCSPQRARPGCRGCAALSLDMPVIAPCRCCECYSGCSLIRLS